MPNDTQNSNNSTGGGLGGGGTAVGGSNTTNAPNTGFNPGTDSSYTAANIPSIMSDQDENTKSADTTPAQQGSAAMQTQDDSVLIPGTKTDTDLPADSTATPNITNEDNDQTAVASSVVNSPQVPQKYGGRKIIATIFGVILLVAGVAAGVYLVQNQQEIRERAASSAECTQSVDCTPIDPAENQGSEDFSRTISHIFITAREYHRFDPPGKNDGCYNVNISGSSLNWQRIGDGPDCKDISNIQVWFGESQIETPTPTGTETPTPTSEITGTPVATSSPTNSPTPTSGVAGSPTPTDVQTTASCSEVKVYSTSWELLDSSDLTTLKPGESIRITVSGTTNSGTFTKARFVVNGVTTSEVTTKKPGTEEFYYQYEIPEGVTNFSFNGEIYHSDLGWI